MKHEFLGFPAADSTFTPIFAITNDVGTPKDPAINPTYRIYESGALIPGGTGSLSKADTHVITGATNAIPIAITTSLAHGLQTGDRVTVASVGGNTAANGDWTVTRVSATVYTLNGSSGNAAYTSGGTGHVTGLYKASLSLTSGAGFTAGATYWITINWTDSAARAMSASFSVV